MKTLPLDVRELGSDVLRVILDNATAAGFSRRDWSCLADRAALARLDQLVGSSLDDSVTEARACLDDPRSGIAVIDIPQLADCPRTEDMWSASVAALLIAQRLSPVRVDGSTRLPFTIYNASSHGEKALKENGIKYYSPEQNLGFHTDGIVQDGALWSPKIVSIYNVYFGYRKPGNFFWVPFALWTRFEEWKEQLANHRFLLEITPITYRKPTGELTVTSQGQYVVSLMKRMGASAVPFFNGEVIRCESDPAFDIGQVSQMLGSLSTNPVRYSIPLKARRLFLLNNWLGAHARDIFEEPLPDVKYTRSFFRAMGEEMLAV